MSSDHLTLYTDALGSVEFAAILGSEWFASLQFDELRQKQTARKESFSTVIAIEIWGKELQNEKILNMSLCN